MFISSPFARLFVKKKLAFDNMVLFTQNKVLTTRKVTEMTRFYCYGNDVTEMIIIITAI